MGCKEKQITYGVYILHRPSVDEDLNLAVKVPGHHDLALGLLGAGPGGLLAPGERLQQEGGHRGEQGAGHHRVVCLDCLVVVVAIFPRSDGLSIG